MSERRALYAGSFDPFTNGHMDIVKKAARLFDRVDVVIGVNVNKPRLFDVYAMRDAMQAAFDAEGLQNVSAAVHAGLTVAYCAEHGIAYHVRGLRNEADYRYEETAAEVNHMLAPTLETVYLRSDEPALSSSVVRELLAFRSDVSAYLPAPVAALIDVTSN